MDARPTSFGPYQLLEKLGEDAIGRVWKAMDARLERVVALQLIEIRDEFSLAGAHELIRSAKAAGQLHHPNIASIYDAGEMDGHFFISMEYVEPDQLIATAAQRVPLEEFYRIGLQASRALHYAHQKGIIHGDIRPDNLAVTGDGQVKVLWFRLSGNTSMDGIPLGETEVCRHAYMSPELIEALSSPKDAEEAFSLSPAVDQFSLGLVLFQLATGRHPFERQTQEDTLRAILSEPLPEPPSGITSDALMEEGSAFKGLPYSCYSVLARMLDKRPEERFSSMGDVELIFGSLLNISNSGSAPGKPLAEPPPKKRRWKSVLVLVLASVALLSAVGYAIRRHRLQNEDSEELPKGAARKVVVVLPLEMVGVSPEMAWMATSFCESMRQGLMRRGDVTVLERTRVREAWEHADGDIRKVVQDLNAEYVVASRLTCDGEDLFLYVQMLKGGDAQILGQLEIEGSRGSILEMEDDLANRLPSLVGQGSLIASLPKARSMRTRELYAKGMEHMECGNPEEAKRAQTFFESGIKIEPDYAPLHAALSEALVLGSNPLEITGDSRRGVILARALEEARRAMELDKGTSVSSRALAGVLQCLGQFREARKVGRLAVEMDPSDYKAHNILGDAYSYGKSDKSRQRAEACYLKAIELAPLDWYAHYRLAVSWQNKGALEESLGRNAIAQGHQPRAVFPYITSALCSAWLGRYDQAKAFLEEGLKIEPEMALIRANLAVLAHLVNDGNAFKYWFNSVENRWPENHSMGVLLRGLNDAMDGDLSSSSKRFTDYLTYSQAFDWESISRTEKRTASANLYQMAQAMALRGNPALAEKLLKESDQLHKGKLAAAKKDPVFTALKL